MTTHYKIAGIVKRIGHCAGPGDKSDLQFMLEDSKDLFVIDSGLTVGLTQVGDKIEFIFETVQDNTGKYNLIHSTKFKNISLDCEYNSPYCAE